MRPHGEFHAGCRHHELPHLLATRIHLRNWLILWGIGIVVLAAVATLIGHAFSG